MRHCDTSLNFSQDVRVGCGKGFYLLCLLSDVLLEWSGDDFSSVKGSNSTAFISKKCDEESYSGKKANVKNYVSVACLYIGFNDCCGRKFNFTVILLLFLVNLYSQGCWNLL